jgi:hypothetical protein
LASARAARRRARSRLCAAARSACSRTWRVSTARCTFARHHAIADHAYRMSAGVRSPSGRSQRAASHACMRSQRHTCMRTQIRMHTHHDVRGTNCSNTALTFLLPSRHISCSRSSRMRTQASPKRTYLRVDDVPRVECERARFRQVHTECTMHPAPTTSTTVT